MIEKPQIVQTAAQQLAKIALVVPRSEIQNEMGPALSELRHAIDTQGIAVAGPWFTHHLRMDPDVFDFEICVPVARPVADGGRVRAGVMPALRAARTVYCGPYEGLGDAWEHFVDWIVANGHTPAPDLWERYVVDFESASDPEKFRTEFTRPLLA